MPKPAVANISRSFAPSPTAITCSRDIPSWLASSCNNRALLSASTTGSMTFSSQFAVFNFQLVGVNIVHAEFPLQMSLQNIQIRPRMAVLYPNLFKVRNSDSTPSVSGSCSAILGSVFAQSLQACNTAPSETVSSLKSISPAIARAVISATFSPAPAAFASSSTTSALISVESISNATNLRSV